MITAKEKRVTTLTVSTRETREKVDFILEDINNKIKKASGFCLIYVIEDKNLDVNILDRLISDLIFAGYCVYVVKNTDTNFYHLKIRW